MAETQIHTRVIIPLLKARGASHVRYVHGSFERGKDIIYVYSDFHGEPCLGVCQVKNEKLTGKSGATSSAMTVLTQLQQCRNTRVLHPATTTKCLPDEVVFYTPFPIPDAPLADAGTFLEQLRANGIRVISPERLDEQIEESLADLFAELAHPGGNISQAIHRYVASHREAGAFELTTTRKLCDFYINLDVAPTSSILGAILDGRLTAESPETVDISKVIYRDLLEMRSALSANLSSAPLFREAEGPSIRNTSGDANSVIVEAEVTNALEMLENTRLAAVEFGQFIDALREELEDAAATLNETYDPSQRASIISDATMLTNECGYLVDHVSAHIDVIQPSTYANESDMNECRLFDAEPSTLHEIGRDLCIVGEAGAGKTSVARELARYSLDRGERCIYFPCAQVRGTKADLLASIHDFVCSCSGGKEVPQGQELIRQTDLLILDGCDEADTTPGDLAKQIQDLLVHGIAPANVPNEDDSRFSIADDLREALEYDKQTRNLHLRKPLLPYQFRRILQRNSGSRFDEPIRCLQEQSAARRPRLVITTRASFDLRLPHGFVHLSLRPLTDSQLEEFFNRWFLDDSTKSDEVMTFFSANPHIKDICRLPMVATILASLHENGFDLPRSRTEVYEKRFGLLLERWDLARSVPSRNRIRARDKLGFLARLALALHRKHRRTFSAAGAAWVWRQGFADAYPDVDIDAVLWELRACNCLIDQEGVDLYSLGHLSFQEYLAAWAIVHSQQLKVLRDNFHNPWWWHTCVFYSGIAGDVSRLLSSIQTKGTLHENDALIDDMLAEARYTPQETRLAVQDIRSIEAEDE